MPELSNRRHALVTAAHDFLLAALPFRHAASEQALTEFVAVAADLKDRTSEAGLVLLDVLSVLNTHAQSPHLLERYLAACRHGSDPLEQFTIYVTALIRNRTVGDSHVERGMAIVESRYSDATLSVSAVAAILGLNHSYFATRFKQRAGMKFSDYLRQTRLGAAARLLAGTNRRVKDIWVSVGYNDASNFDHQFKARFGVSPAEYRRRSGVEPGRVPEPHAAPSGSSRHIESSCDVLIVDDYENTRETVGRYLRSMGYSVAMEATGTDGLEAASRLRPHTIILDYQLPDMDGIAWLRAVRHQGQSPEAAAVVLFTADINVVERRQELDELRATYLSKLCDIDELVALIGGFDVGSSTGRPTPSN